MSTNNLRNNENREIQELQRTATTTLSSLKALAIQFRSHQKLRQELQARLEQLLQDNGTEAETPEVLELLAQIYEIQATENSIIEGLRLATVPEAFEVRARAELAPRRQTLDPGVGKSGKAKEGHEDQEGHEEQEGFYFPRR
ncbi:hypothetical protein BH11CYA1_BH11CYA1_09450 [soil metagenome]